jgi:hypothetical protein
VYGYDPFIFTLLLIGIILLSHLIEYQLGKSSILLKVILDRSKSQSANDQISSSQAGSFQKEQ